MSAFSIDYAIENADMVIADDETFIYPESIWHLSNRNTSVKQLGPFSTVIYSLTFDRDPHYHLTLLLIPTGALTIVQLAAFLLPPHLVERPAFSITVVLALQVLVSSYSNLIPVTSKPVYFIYYIDSNMVFGAAVTVYMLAMCRFTNDRMGKNRRGVYNGRRVIVVDMLFGCLSTFFIIALNLIFFSFLL